MAAQGERSAMAARLGDVIRTAGFHGAVFDVDGVLVDSPHEHAWRDALAQLMETSWRAICDETMYSPERFTPEVYRAHMSGKTTESGARAALHYSIESSSSRSCAVTRSRSSS